MMTTEILYDDKYWENDDDDWGHEDGEDEYWFDEFEDFECLYGPKCCMPGLHFPSECHTAEMIEAEMEYNIGLTARPRSDK